MSIHDSVEQLARCDFSGGQKSFSRAGKWVLVDEVMCLATLADNALRLEKIKFLLSEVMACSAVMNVPASKYMELVGSIQSLSTVPDAINMCDSMNIDTGLIQ